MDGGDGPEQRCFGFAGESCLGIVDHHREEIVDLPHAEREHVRVVLLLVVLSKRRCVPRQPTGRRQYATPVQLRVEVRMAQR
jgi:hypothetical protein